MRKITNTQLFIFNVRRVMKEKGLKQLAVAEKAHLTPNALSNMLTGRKIITVEHIPYIADALDVNVSELFKKGGE